MGELRKTNKASLLHALEKDVAPDENIEGETVTVLDGMALVQKARTTEETFGDLSDTLLRTVLFLGKDSKRIDLVFDVYCDESIKNAERLRRGSGTLVFQNLLPTQPIKQWTMFLSSTQNKRELIAFLVNDWKRKSNIVEDKYLYVGYEDKCYCFNPGGNYEVPELGSSQEEADTRMLLHIKHEDDHSNQPRSFIVHTPDTDVLILCLGHLHHINGNIYIKTGVKDKSRLINLRRIKDKLDLTVGETGCSSDDLCEALVSLHAFTGCDTVSAFAGKGKLKALKMMTQQKYIAAFKVYGTSWVVEDDLLQTFEEFVCALYGGSGTSE